MCWITWVCSVLWIQVDMRCLVLGAWVFGWNVCVLDQSLNIGTWYFGIWFVNVWVDYLDSESERRITVRGPPGLVLAFGTLYMVLVIRCVVFGLNGWVV